MPKNLSMFSLLLLLITKTPYAGQTGHHGYVVNAEGGTRECLTCHDGTSARPVSSCLRGNCPIGGSHPVDKLYPPLGRENEFVPLGAGMATPVRLVNGSVSCISCHNLYNPQPLHPIVDPATTDLCLLCHLK